MKKCDLNTPKAKDKKYICNPETGRWVLKIGKVGKRIVSQYGEDLIKEYSKTLQKDLFYLEKCETMGFDPLDSFQLIRMLDNRILGNELQNDYIDIFDEAKQLDVGGWVFKLKTKSDDVVIRKVRPMETRIHLYLTRLDKEVNYIVPVIDMACVGEYNVLVIPYYDNILSDEFSQARKDVQSLYEKRLDQGLNTLAWLRKHGVAHGDTHTGNWVVDSENDSILLFDLDQSIYFPEEHRNVKVVQETFLKDVVQFVEELNRRVKKLNVKTVNVEKALQTYSKLL